MKLLVRWMAVLTLLAPALPLSASDDPKIPVVLDMPEAGYATLVVEDESGRRVRNLVAETHFEAGRHVLYWNGRDESGGLVEAADGVFRTAGELVKPGAYRVRGLRHSGIEMRYEFSIYSEGNPPWQMQDGTGRWLADHTPPVDVLYLPKTADNAEPRMLISSFVAEAGDGVVWTDLNGRKVASRSRIGGHWTGALHLARDDGPDAVKDIDAYALSSWLINWSRPDRGLKAEIRLVGLSGTKDQMVWLHRFEPAEVPEPGVLPVGQFRASEKRYVAGLAAYNGIIAVNLIRMGELRFIDTRRGEPVGAYPLADARGLAFDRQGRLLALVGTTLRRYELRIGDRQVEVSAEETLISSGLENPNRVTVDPHTGHLYISDWGTSQVKVFDQGGAPIRMIGKPGGLQLGPYDAERMQHPSGMAVTTDGKLWVAEESYTPKRVSLWSTDGRFERAFYGPSPYGAGGHLGPGKRSFYLHDYAGMEFALDWTRGAWELKNIYHDPSHDRIGLFDPSPRLGITGGPQTPLDHQGRRYLTNAYNAHPTNGPELLGIWKMENGVAKPVAVLGDASRWPLMFEKRMASCLPPGTDLAKYHPGRSPIFVAWSDLNDDGLVQPNEVTARRLENFGSTTRGDYRVGRVAIDAEMRITTSFTYQLSPRGFTPGGAPIYDTADLVAAHEGPIDLKFDEGHDALAAGDLIVVTGNPIRGFRDGELIWTYPNGWPQLHPGHKAPPQQYSGQLIATTKIIGRPADVGSEDVAPIWAYNGDRGQIYLMTMDGLFLTQLFRIPNADGGRLPDWADLPAKRGMALDHLHQHGENFYPTFSQADDGGCYLVTGKQHSSIVRVEGLENVASIPPTTLHVTPEMLSVSRADDISVAKEPNALIVALRGTPPVVDGHDGDWAAADWATLDRTTSAAIAVSGDRLYAIYRTNDAHLLNNRPESLPTLFKTGGSLDLMLGVDPNAPPGRTQPAAGDLRLLVTQVEGRPVAVLYQPVAEEADDDSIAFSSPWRTVEMDRVADVSSEVVLTGRDGTFEFSVPLRMLGLHTEAGAVIAGDIGVLRGKAGRTAQRLYWHNKATGIVDDAPSEAALTPAAWGVFRFETVE